MALIVIIDDDSERVAVVTHALTAAGHEIRAAGTGVEGLALLDALAPDLVLLDVVLPDTTGLEALAAILARPTSSAVPVVLFSSLAVGSDLQAQGIESGAVGYLAWPVAPRELRARVALALRLAPARSTSHALAVLTPRQQQVVELVAAGLTTKEVALRLGVAHRTAETHRAAAMKRLDVHSTAALVRYAVAAGLTTD